MKDGFKEVKTIEIPTDVNSIQEVERMIDEVSETNNISGFLYGNILISVTEAFNNAVIHGNKFDKNLKVVVLFLEKDKEICFSILDKGNGFDYENLPDPTAPENIEKINGRGIFLMKNLSDEVEFEDGGSRVNIYFKTER